MDKERDKKGCVFLFSSIRKTEPSSFFVCHYLEKVLTFSKYGMNLIDAYEQSFR